MKETKKKQWGQDLHPWEGAAKEESFPHPGQPLLQGETCGTERELQRLRGECSSWLAAARTDRPV